MLRRRRAARAGTADCASAIASNSTDVDLAFCSYRDFYCPDNPQQECWGASQKQIVSSLASLYDAFDADDNVWRNIGFILSFGIALHFVYLYRLFAAGNNK